MKKEEIKLKIERAKTNIINQIRQYHITKTVDEAAFKNDYNDIINFEIAMSRIDFNKLSLSSDRYHIWADMYNSKRGIRVRLEISYTINYNHTTPTIKIDRQTTGVILTRKQSNYRIHQKCENLNIDEILVYLTTTIETMGTYEKTSGPPKINLDEIWRTPNPQEHTESEDKAWLRSNSTIHAVATIGVCRLTDAGRIEYDAIENPGQDVYFHTDARDFRGRQIHFITNENTDRYLIATKRGTYVTIDKSDVLFKEGGYPLYTKTNITLRDIELVQAAIKRWIKGQTTT